MIKEQVFCLITKKTQTPKYILPLKQTEKYLTSPVSDNSESNIHYPLLRGCAGTLFMCLSIYLFMYLSDFKYILISCSHLKAMRALLIGIQFTAEMRYILA